VDYAELHAHSWFSFLDGVSSPAALARAAAEAGIPAMALTDHQTLAGAVQFWKACQGVGVRAIVGAEVTVAPWRQGGAPWGDGVTDWRPAEGPFPHDRGHHLTLLAPDRAAYGGLCRILSAAGLRDAKGASVVDWDTLRRHGGGLVALTGCMRGEIPSALLAGDERRAETVLGALREVFDRRLYLEVQHHGLPEQAVVADGLVDLGRRCGVPAVATGNVHYATADDAPLHDVVTCIRHTCTLEAAGGLLRSSAGHHVRGAAAMARRYRGHEDLLERAAAVAAEVSFGMGDLHFPLPDFTAPSGEDPFEYLARLTWAGAHDRYGPPVARVRRQIRHELDVIRRLGLAPYFLLVHDIVRFARERGILVQGRGSAANSAVCYCLAVTSVDPVGMELLFERFLSDERREPPDIDIDIEHERREEVIQYVYERYGREHAAMVANVVTYHMRSAVREVAKVFGFSARRVEAISRSLSDGMTRDEVLADLALVGFDPTAADVGRVVDVARAMVDMPRHLGIHPGGMVICAEALSGMTSLERARMDGRTIVPWDKDDTADVGMLKMDLLGLGMLTCISRAIRLVREHTGVVVDPARIDYDDQRVYDLMCRADTVGVFQIESRAQMSTLPRMQPRTFYDIVVEIALIRPGPIQGDMVHPYLRRRRGEEPVTCLHPLVEPALRRTLGVPLFQEQGMKVAVLAAGFTPAEADELRRAMGHKRSLDKIQALRQRLVDGMRANGVDDDTIERIIKQLAGFASYGFPESHAASFALLVYVSAWLKVHYPWAFYCALLNSQPMGCYRPGSIVMDARRHGVVVRPVDMRHSRHLCSLEPNEGGQGEPWAMRLGYGLVQGLGEGHGERLDGATDEQPWRSLQDVVRRSRLPEEMLLRLARVGAFAGFGLSRQGALWAVKRLVRLPGGMFEGLAEEEEKAEETTEDNETSRARARDVSWEYAELGFGATCHPMQLVRDRLSDAGVFDAKTIWSVADGTVVQVAGEAIVKQKPPTARGMVFVSLEDEQGIVNTVLSPQVYRRHKRLVLDGVFLQMEGVVERRYGAINVRARRVRPLDVVPVGRRPRKMYTGIG